MVGLDSSPPFNDFACFKLHGRRGGCRLLFGHWQAACTICGVHSLQYPRRIMHLSFRQSTLHSRKSNKVQAAFEYAKSSLYLFIYLIF